MTEAAAPSRTRPTLSPSVRARPTEGDRRRAYGEDLVTEPRPADSGRRLGAESHARVQSLLRAGVDAAAIRAAATARFAAAEAAAGRRGRNRALAALAVALAIGIAASVTTLDRGLGHRLLQIGLLAGIGIMMAHGFLTRASAERRDLLRRRESRVAVWRDAVDDLAAR